MKCLPKWPQMRVIGKPITSEQAKEIIFKTDDFLTDISRYSGGNKRAFNTAYREAAGLAGRDDVEDIHTMDRFEFQTQLRASLGCLELEYLGNHWASSSFVYGAHGWCHPDGTLFNRYNVGQWPTEGDLIAEWSRIAETFPFLDLHAMFMSGANCEDNTEMVFGLHVVNGKIERYEEPKPEIVEAWETKLKAQPEPVFLWGENGLANENGLPGEWVAEYAARVRKAAEAIDRTNGRSPSS